MDAFLSLLLLTFLIFVIMRLVAPHRQHGQAATTLHHGVPHATSGHLPEGVDPVCGRTIAANEGFLVAHEGVERRFCSLTCVETFEQGAATQGGRAA